MGDYYNGLATPERIEIKQGKVGIYSPGAARGEWMKNYSDGWVIFSKLT